MQVAVLSDIHDNVWKLAVALECLKGAEILVCCGDLCSPFVLDQLARGFSGPIHIVFGNNDADLYRITAKNAKYPHVQLRGEFFEANWDGRRIAVNHFNYIALPIARSGEYDAVFFGHNHVYQNERVGKTLALNPGSIMGCQFDAEANRTDVDSTFALYDTATGEAMGFRIVGSEVAVMA